MSLACCSVRLLICLAHGYNSSYEINRTICWRWWACFGYSKYAELNRLAYNFPIYIGKAVPKGWRQSRAEHTDETRASELFSRLTQHASSVRKVDSLSIENFTCRFMIFEGTSSDMIGTLEAALIKWKRPIWNSFLDGFGNHDPGKGRYEQAKSGWPIVERADGPERRYNVRLIVSRRTPTQCHYLFRWLVRLRLQSLLLILMGRLLGDVP